MEKILAVFKKDPKLQEVMQAPMLSESDKTQIVQTILQQSGAQDKDNVVKNFLQTLVQNNRLSVLEPVCEKFATLMSAYKGEVELVVTSAAVRGLHMMETTIKADILQPIDPKILKQLEAAVAKSQYVGQGKKLKVVPKVCVQKHHFRENGALTIKKVNPDIKGGLIVEIGDRTIDLSVSAKLAKMNKLLRDQL